MTQPRGLTAARTDVENSERLVALFGTDLRFVGKWGKGLAWAGNRWVLDDTGKWHLAGVQTARVLFAEASPELEEARIEHAKILNEISSDSEEAADKKKDDPRVKKAAAKMKAAGGKFAWAIKSQSSARISAMVTIAHSVPKLAILHTSLDADPWLLNVQNGTIDLKTGELREHRREDLITKLAPVDFDPDAQCPTWLAFLDRVMAGNADLVDYLQRFVGYCLTGSTTEHVLVFLYGGGANGKSTFLSTLHAMLGDYAMPASRGLLFGGKGERHPTELASLFGRRFVTGSEVEEGLSFDEALIKDLTGGDPINARRMNEDEWTFEPTHKLALAGNHKPSVRGDDEGIWRRMRLIPWLVQIPMSERDQRLPDKLRTEMPGILAWSVKGCLAWQKNGLQTPEAVTRATTAYRTENDLLGEFLRLYTVFEETAKVSRKDLRETYERYCKETGAEPFGAKRFSGRLRERGAGDAAIRVGTKVVDAWKGMRLATDLEREMLARGLSVVTCRDQNSTPMQSTETTKEVPTSPYVPTEEEEGVFDDLLRGEV